MGEDPEKRFHSIMDKLFQSPKSASTPSCSSGVQLSRGKKRSNPESALALVEPQTRMDMIKGFQHSLSSAEAPLCRPWDRGDLMRRIATFRSMTWFAKPKVVSAVNCARRGWINVEMDIIACEACGARLLFSTPSSWTQQQVEKAALVFSLKLDSGHKLLCPWIDNICDERLADFPPSPPPVLVDKFRERSSALLQLSALPVISSSAIEYMRSPRLEEFLRQSPTVEYSNGCSISEIETLGNESESDSVKLYYQAQKLISLCGWEPRSLPYVVDCNDKAKEFSKGAEILNSSDIVTNGKNPSISVHSATADESVEANEYSGTLSGYTDPNSVVLDCRLCGASVGLWTFSLVTLPLELIRLVGQTEVIIEKVSRQHLDNENHVVPGGGSNCMAPSADRPTNLNLTIAGGPLPAKQNFKATISLPVIGRNLRARFSYDSEFRDRSCSKQESQSESGNKLSGNKNLFLEEKDLTEYNSNEKVSQPEVGELPKSQTYDQGQFSNDSCNQSYCLNLESGESAALRKEDSSPISLEGSAVTAQEALPETQLHDSNVESPPQSTQDMVLGSEFGRSVKLPENAENIGATDPTMWSFDISEIGISSDIDMDVNVTTGNGKHSEKDLIMITSDNCNQQQIPGADILCSEGIANMTVVTEGETFSGIPNTVGDQAKNQEGIKDKAQNPGSEVVPYGAGKYVKQLSLDEAMAFDPIRQHRHFCPWISSIASGTPGWQQTLSALQRQKEQSDLSPTKSPLSASIIKVDDPITSVRQLFKSPSAKRMKTT